MIVPEHYPTTACGVWDDPALWTFSNPRLRGLSHECLRHDLLRGVITTAEAAVAADEEEQRLVEALRGRGLIPFDPMDEEDPAQLALEEACGRADMAFCTFWEAREQFWRAEEQARRDAAVLLAWRPTKPRRRR
ncbi:MAG: hypothetical protein ACREQ5_18545 [Candidatus Dormibacteria bacterium]